eukprot:205314-Pleurochrysis_carterae.AAC.2
MTHMLQPISAGWGGGGQSSASPYRSASSLASTTRSSTWRRSYWIRSAATCDAALRERRPHRSARRRLAVVNASAPQRCESSATAEGDSSSCKTTDISERCDCAVLVLPA